MRKLFFIANDYRQTRISGFIQANCFGNFNLMGNIRPGKPTLFKFVYYNIKLILSNVIIVSDIEGIIFLEQFIALKNKKIYLLMWNSEKELSGLNIKEIESIYRNLTVCFFFKDAAEKASKIYHIKTKYLRSPLIPHDKKNEIILNRIIYCSEVDIFSELSKINLELDNKIWDYANKILVEGSFLLYDLDLQANFFKEFEISFDLSWVLKNRLRFLYAKKLTEIYGPNFLLIGNDWINLGFDARPSNYDLNILSDLYSDSKVCLDLLSKSSNEAIFERVMQIISSSDGLLQLKTTDSEEVYGEYTNERTFDNFSSLKIKIDNMFSLQQKAFHDRGKLFRKHIYNNNTSFI